MKATDRAVIDEACAFKNQCASHLFANLAGTPLKGDRLLKVTNNPKRRRGEHRMTDEGHQRRFGPVRTMSGLPLTAEVPASVPIGREGP